jgi:hypothetical protein
MIRTVHHVLLELFYINKDNMDWRRRNVILIKLAAGRVHWRSLF